MKKFRNSIASVLAFILVFSCFSGTSASAAFSDTKIGDADADGIISSSDARIILRSAVGIEAPAKHMEMFYDVDSDNLISAADARSALRISVGLEPETQAPDKEKILSTLLRDVSQTELTELTKKLCEKGSRSIIFSANNKAAQTFISDTLSSYGYSPSEQKFRYVSVDVTNITTTLKPDSKKKILLISTHYDCSDKSQGAVDNASGVAVMLHIARLLKEIDAEAFYEIRFAFFSAEEYGYHGAYHYISRLSESEKSRLIVLNIDMAGFSSSGNDTYLAISTEPVTDVYPWTKAKHNDVSLAFDEAKVILGNLGEKGYYSPVAAGKHDSVPFRLNGIPATTLSWREINPDKALGSDFNLAAPSQIHTSLDTFENLDKTSVYNTARLVFGAVINLCF